MNNNVSLSVHEQRGSLEGEGRDILGHCWGRLGASLHQPTPPCMFPQHLAPEPQAGSRLWGKVRSLSENPYLAPRYPGSGRDEDRVGRGQQIRCCVGGTSSGSAISVYLYLF